MAGKALGPGCVGRHITKIERAWIIAMMPVVVAVGGFLWSRDGLLQENAAKNAAQDTDIARLEAEQHDVTVKLDVILDKVSSLAVAVGRLEERLRAR